MPKQKSGKSDIQSVVGRSGNNHHFQVVRALRELGWTVQVSPYYNDNVTDKSRELDLVAEKVYTFSGRPIPGPAGNILVRLYVECKYVPSENVTAFWFDDKDLKRASSLIERVGMRTPERNIHSEQHHYYAEKRVAKLFDSDSRDVFQTALNQCLNATVYFRSSGPFLNVETGSPTITVHYPLIITNTFDHFFEVDQSGQEKHAPLTKPFQLEVNYAYFDSSKSSQKEYFLIDILSLPQLPTFLGTLQSQDIAPMADQLAWDRKMSQREDLLKGQWER